MISRDNGSPSKTFTITGGALAIAGLAVALTVYGHLFTPTLWGITACAAVAIVFVVSHALPIRGLRMRRAGVVAEAIFLDLPIVAPLFVFDGAAGVVAAALAISAGFTIAVVVRRTGAQTDLARHGVLRVLVALALIPFATQMAGLDAYGLAIGSAIFAGGLALATLLFLTCLSAPISALAFHMTVGRVLGRVIRDPRTWIVGAANVIWSTIVRDSLSQGHVVISIAMWLPVCVTALLLRTIDDQRAELYRLRLVRDAVQAMLGDRDPLPQINAILATLRVPSFDETVTVLAATSSRLDDWRAVTQLGPALSPAGDDLRRRALVRLKFSGSNSITLHDHYYITYAFAARASDGELHGALVVHRRNDRPMQAEQVGQFTNAAHELSPLLRDMRSIAAAQNAATIDPLTSLFNRATVLERLQEMLVGAATVPDGAILLLDIDHFKTINDQLGHAAGDECLRKIGEVVRNAVRAGDTPGRVGGEEFLVVMPGASRDIALTVGERLRLAVALGGMRYANGDPVTASIGVSAVAVGDNVETILARADRALYEAKRTGRNRMVEATEETA